MAVERFSFTMEPELGAAVRRAAAQAGVSVSTWVAEAAADRVRNQLLGELLDEWEAEQGPITDEEREEARAKLGFPPLRREGSG